MYAIFRAGGKQYKVQAGDTVRVDKLENNLGDTFNLAEILMIGGDSTVVGAPLVTGAVVKATVVRQAKAPKVIVFKKKRRQGYRRMHGHRSFFTELFIESITTPEGKEFKSDKKALVIDPVKIEARKADAAQKAKTNRKASSKVEAAETKTAAPKKKVAKKATAKKTTSTSAKAGGAKKATKKTATKK